MTSRFVITHHAVQRFLERYDGTSYPSIGEARRVLEAELEHGVPFGAQVGNGALYLLPCGLVAAAVLHHGCCFVKTILLREHAIAGMESRVTMRRPIGDVMRQETQRRDDNTLTSEEKAELRELAGRHFKAGISRKERYAILRERGFDPAGTAGEIYRAAYRALIDDMWARKREEYRRAG